MEYVSNDKDGSLEANSLDIPGLGFLRDVIMIVVIPSDGRCIFRDVFRGDVDGRSIECTACRYAMGVSQSEIRQRSASNAVRSRSRQHPHSPHVLSTYHLA